jgi:hypothetical protein
MTRKKGEVEKDSLTFRYDPEHPAYKRMIERARTRGVSLQQVIHDYIVSMHVLETGGDLSDLLWGASAGAP